MGDEQKRLEEQREDEARHWDESHGDDARVASSDHSGSDASGAGPVMLLAASPDVGPADDAKASDKTDTKAQSNSVLCREDHVSQKDCDEWVADQLARRAARKADEEKRGAARKADEQEHQEEQREHEVQRQETALRGSAFSLSASS